MGAGSLSVVTDGTHCGTMQQNQYMGALFGGVGAMRHTLGKLQDGRVAAAAL